MRRRVAILITLTCSLTRTASADSIVLGNQHYTGVYIIETARAYYVCLPEEGRSISAAKNDPTLKDITVDDDPDRRAALYAEYKARKAQLDHAASGAAARPQASPEVSDFKSEISTMKFEVLSQHQGMTPPGSTVPELRLKGEPFLVPPEIQATIDANLGLGSQQQSAGPGGNGATAGGTNRPGGRGSGRAGAGAGGAGGGGGAAGFSNISDLFSTTNDAEVGESPGPFNGR